MAKQRHNQKEKKRADKRKALRTATQEQARREEQAGKKMKSPSDFIEGFNADAIALLQHVNMLETYLKQRVEQANRLKEENPEKFNVLRTEVLSDLLDEFNKFRPELSSLMNKISEAEDKSTVGEKFLYLSNALSELMDVQRSFEVISQKLQEAEYAFNTQIQSLVNPSEYLETTEDSDAELQRMFDGEPTAPETEEASDAPIDVTIEETTAPEVEEATIMSESIIGTEGFEIGLTDSEVADIISDQKPAVEETTEPEPSTGDTDCAE